MTSIRSSLAYSLINTHVVTLLQFASSLVMARLLTPSDFGVYSVAVVFTGIAQIFRDFGASSYLIQAKQIDTELLRAASGLMISLALLIAGILVVGAPYIADFYREPVLTEILWVLALNFAVTPLGAVTLAVVRRDMRFKEMAILGISTTVISIAVTIVLAYLGYGPMSLAWGAVANTFATVLFSLPLRTPEMRWMPTLRGVGKMLSFGGTASAANMLNFVNNSATDMLLGRVMNMEAVGLFSRASSLNRYFSTALGGVISPVLLPWLSQLNRDGVSLKDVYLKVTELVTGLSWPVYALIAVLAEPLIQVLFGSQWGGSVPLVPYISLAAVLSSVYAVSSPLFLARGRPGLNLAIEGIGLPLKVAAILVSAPFGLEAVAAAWCVVTLLSSVVLQMFLIRELDLGFRELMRQLRKSIVCTLVPVIFVWGVLKLADGQSYWWQLAACGFLGAASWWLVLRWVGHPLLGEFNRILLRR